MAPPIKPFTPGEIKREIENLNEYKAPGFELITATILRQLPQKAIVLLTIIFNGMVRLSYFQLTWKFAQIILIHKPGKPLNETSSYRPIPICGLVTDTCYTNFGVLCLSFSTQILFSLEYFHYKIFIHEKCLENENDKFQKSLSRPSIIDARAHYWAAARWLRNTVLDDNRYFLGTFPQLSSQG
jgi:hypothetical protein